ncbi:DUF819 domain-containing protein [Luteithermobacter gelatinilyticus]|uniref:DUF819 family protein n=1 Tax=Luteithermobacter gelatinilyticus TaxID=2582913 RepID=UPI001106F89A|nr:DUF819 family protein [Luteithermobacter gelatinilyticus]
MPLIAQDNVLLLSAILFCLAWFGFWADTNKIGKATSGALWVIIGGILLSNFQVTPFRSPVTDFVGEYLVSLGIPLLLFKADLRKIFKESGRIMITFSFAALGTIAGAIIGFFLLDLGEIGPKVAGVYTGGFIGGTINFVAVSKAVNMTPAEFSVAIGANSIVSVMALMTLVTLPSIALVRRLLPSQIMEEAQKTEQKNPRTKENTQMHLTHISGALALSFVICALSYTLADILELGNFRILFVTALAILVANIAPRTMSKLEGEFEMGMLIMYVFFAAIGLGTNVTAFLDSAVHLFVYSVLIIVIHFMVVLILAKLFRVDLAEALTGSGAALVGPVPTAAIAISRGWTTLITPGIMCGIFGYVIANFIGVTVTALLH